MEHLGTFDLIWPSFGTHNGDFDQKFFWKVKCPTYDGGPPLGFNIDTCITNWLTDRMLTIFRNAYLCVVSRPSFVRVCTPFLVLWPRFRGKERNIVTGILFTLCTTIVIVWPRRGVEVRIHLYWAVGRRVFRTTEMEHFNRLWIQ